MQDCYGLIQYEETIIELRRREAASADIHKNFANSQIALRIKRRDALIMDDLYGSLYESFTATEQSIEADRNRHS